MIINIRGTNGSGKTTLARQLIGPDAQPIDLVQYDSPTKRDPERKQWVEGYGQPGGFLAVGSYKQGCGGMDTIPSFELQQVAGAEIIDPGHRAVMLALGVIDLQPLEIGIVEFVLVELVVVLILLQFFVVGRQLVKGWLVAWQLGLGRLFARQLGLG